MAQPILPTNIPQPAQAADEATPMQQISLPGMSITPTSAERMPAANDFDPSQFDNFDPSVFENQPPQAPNAFSPDQGGTLDVNAGGGARDWNDVYARFKASFGEKPEEKAQILQKIYGGKNVKLVSGEPWIRRAGEKKFQPLDAAHFTGLMELAGDVADLGNAAVRGVPGIALGVAGSTVGPAASVGGAALGGAMGATMANSLQSQYGSEPQKPLADIALAAITDGVSAGIPGVYRGIKNAYVEGVGSKEARVRLLQQIRLGLNDFANAYRINPDIPLASEKVGDLAANTISIEKKSLNAMIRNAEDRAIAQGGTRRFPGTQLQTQLKSYLDDYVGRGVSFDPNGRAVVMRGVDAEGRPTQAIAPFGFEGGTNFLNKIADDYNELLALNKSGGLDAKQWIDKGRFYADMADYEHQFNRGQAAGRFAQLNDAALQDRATAFGPLDPSIAKSFATYQDRIRPLGQFSQMLSQAEQQNKLGVLAHGIFDGNSPKRVQDFLTLFKDVKAADGYNGTVFDRLKGLYVEKLVGDSVSPAGMFNPDKMFNELKSGKEMIDKVLSPDEINQLKRFVRVAQRVKTGDLTSMPDIMHLLYKVPFLGKMLVSTQAQVVYDLTNASPNLVKALDSETLKELSNLPLSQRQKYFDMAKKLQDKLMKPYDLHSGHPHADLKNTGVYTTMHGAADTVRKFIENKQTAFQNQ